MSEEFWKQTGTMSGRDQKPGAIGKIKEMIRTVSESVSKTCAVSQVLLSVYGSFKRSSDWKRDKVQMQSDFLSV